MKSYFTKLIFILFIINIISCFCQASKQNDVAQLIREGNGKITSQGANGNGWPSGYIPINQEKKKPYSLGKNDYEILPITITNTWNPENFTSLVSYKKGYLFKKIKLIVHGLELHHLVDGFLPGASFDLFIKNKLNSEVPLGNNFIKYYPYFLFKKVTIAASVVNENLTATFCDIGFILSSPPLNFLFGGSVDLHSPLDMEFYRKGKPNIRNFQKKFPLTTLSNFLPEKKIISNSAYKAVKNKSNSKIKEVSWYNEVVLLPTVDNNSIEIVGIYIRCGQDDLDQLRQREDVQKIFELAEVYDLPIIHIFDQQSYKAL